MAESVRNIAVLVGSLRKGSLNRKMANALRALAPEHLKLEIVEIGNLPLYNADLDENPPQEWVAVPQPHQSRGCGSVRHARVQPLGSRGG